MLVRDILKTLLAISVVATSSAAGAAVTLAPYLPSSTTTTAGSNATFIKIDNAWQGSTVLWDEDAKKYGQGLPIGATYGSSWGTGLWGIPDFNTILNGGVAAERSWSGLVSAINFGDDCYNTAHSSIWGAASLAPIFTGTSQTATCTQFDEPLTKEGAQDDNPAQNNWISYFTGYIRITDATQGYNFSVLYDDGFFFNLVGAGGTTYSMSRDYLNPRDRLGFAEDFSLSEGLYMFQLGAYDRLEAGIVDLRWNRGGTTDWTLIPTENLATIPEPGTLGLLATGLMAVGLASRRHARGCRATRESHVA